MDKNTSTMKSIWVYIKKKGNLYIYILLYRICYETFEFSMCIILHEDIKKVYIYENIWVYENIYRNVAYYYNWLFPLNISSV